MHRFIKNKMWIPMPAIEEVELKTKDINIIRNQISPHQNIILHLIKLHTLSSFDFGKLNADSKFNAIVLHNTSDIPH